MTITAPHLDPMIREWQTRIAAVAGEHSPDADERSRSRMLSDRLFAEFGEVPSPAERTTHVIPSAAGDLRIDEYRPAGAVGELPAYLVLHGGAFRLGDLDELINVAFCSNRAVDAGYAVFCPEYALAPARPHPAASIDAQAALTWLIEHSADLGIDARRIVVGGVSAGGALAASLCLWARDSGLGVSGQLLEVPVVDLSDDAPWLPEYGELNGLPSVSDLRAGYASDQDAETPAVSPLRGDLHDLPTTHVMTAEFDPLRAGGEAFAERLIAAGNRVTGTRHLGALHGTQSLLKGYRGARLWHREVVAVLSDFAERGAQG
jgi:acetyl esterase